MQVQSLGQEDSLEEEMATHSSIAWRIAWTVETGGLPSMGLQSLTRLRSHKRNPQENFAFDQDSCTVASLPE